MLQSLRGVVLAGALAASFCVQSADEEALVVTATRTPTRASTVVSDVSVISRERIERASQSTLGELLQAQPGVQVTSTGGAGSATTVSIRGGSGSQTLILIDGQRMSSATQGTTALEHIPLNQIDRIEILRGPASSLYGADAVNGVVQIFTRRGEGAPRLSAEAGGGTYRTAAGSANYGGRSGDTSFNLNAGHIESDGFSATRPGAFGFNPDNDGYRNRNFSGQLARRLNGEHELGMRVLRAEGRTHFDQANCDPTFLVCTNDFDNFLDQTLTSYSLYSRNRIASNWTSELVAGRGEDRITSYSLDPVAATVSGQTFATVQDQLSWQNSVALGSGTLLLVAEQREEQVSSNTVAYTVSERTSRSLAAGYQAVIGAHVVQASARRDRYTQFSGRSTGSLGYSYEFTAAWRATASAGTAYRVPTFNDLYWPVDFASFYVGNPNLQPERARNREAGIVYEAAGERFSVTAYHNRVSDLIAFGDAPAPASFDTTVNVGSAVLKGATTRYERRFGSWTVYASYDALSAKDEDTGRYLIRRAARQGTAELRYGDKRWGVGVQLVASGPRWVDQANTEQTHGYGIVNVDMKYRLSPEWSLFGRVNNLLDKDYELVKGFNTPGANLFAGFRYAPK